MSQVSDDLNATPLDLDELVEINEGTLPPEGPMEDVDLDLTIAADARLSRNQILERSQSWIDERVPYSQTDYHSNRYGKYRQDCSGFVSMCWKLHTSYTTATIMQVAKKISRGELRPGDALWRRAGNKGHIAVFVRWGNDQHTKPIVREEWSRGHVCEQRLWSQGYAESFTPIRYDKVD